MDVRAGKLMKFGILVIGSLIVQYCLGWPWVPAWIGDIYIPMVFLVGACMLFHGRKWPYLALAIGLGWDLLMESVTGPCVSACFASSLVVLLSIDSS